jgi:hypothetical protein
LDHFGELIRFRISVEYENVMVILFFYIQVNLSIYRIPFRNMVVDPRLSYIVSGAAGGDERQRDVATSLMLNISGHSEVFNCSDIFDDLNPCNKDFIIHPQVHADLLPGHLFENVIAAFKKLFIDPSTSRQIRIAILGLLTNLGIRIPNFLVYILGSDLIQVMEILTFIFPSFYNEKRILLFFR